MKKAFTGADGLSRALKAIEEDKFNSDAWLAALQSVRAASGPDSDKYVAILKRFLDVFPTSTTHWTELVDIYTKRVSNTADAAAQRTLEGVFRACLPKAPCVELWKRYLTYTTQKLCKMDIPDFNDRKFSLNALDFVPALPPLSRKKLRDAYEFALKHIGWDIDADDLWERYLLLMKRLLACAEDRNAFMEEVRNAYKRAILVPIRAGDKIAEEFMAWEKETGGQKKSIDHCGFHNDFVRGMLSVRKEAFGVIKKNMLAIPPGKKAETKAQLGYWKKLVAFEMENHLRLVEKDFVENMDYIFRQAINVFYRHPYFWQAAAQFMFAHDNIRAAKEYLKDGEAAVPDSMLLAMARAEILEITNDLKGAKEVFIAMGKRFVANQQSPNFLPFIHFMHFLRRTEGVEAARRAFITTKSIPGCPYQVYVSAALIEFFCNKEPAIARKIFEAGAQLFENNVEFVEQYMTFLFHMNSEEYVESVGKRMLPQLNLPATHPLWEMYHQHRRFFLTQPKSEAAVKDSFMKAFGDDSAGSLCGRYAFLSIQPLSECDKEAFGMKTVKEAPAPETKCAMPDLTKWKAFDPTKVDKAQIAQAPQPQVQAVPPPTIPENITLLPPILESLQNALKERFPGEYYGPYVDVPLFLSCLANVDMHGLEPPTKRRK